jgi:hypothetical protein
MTPLSSNYFFINNLSPEGSAKGELVPHQIHFKIFIFLDYSP